MGTGHDFDRVVQEKRQPFDRLTPLKAPLDFFLFHTISPAVLSRVTDAASMQLLLAAPATSHRAETDFRRARGPRRARLRGGVASAGGGTAAYRPAADAYACGGCATAAPALRSP